MAHVEHDTATVRRLRFGVGVLGMVLPFAVTVGNMVQTGETVLLSSISGSYYTGMRDVFVGSLAAIGAFLIGYRYAPVDDALSTIAGLAAIAVALFPTAQRGQEVLVTAAGGTTGMIHGIAAAVLFLVLAIFCFFLFPRSATPGAMTTAKKSRNVIYYLCGFLIVAGLGLAALAGKILPGEVTSWLKPMFWGQSVALFAFGVAWFTKSNIIFRSRES